MFADFDDFDVTTMTLVMSLNKEITNKRAIFYLMPVVEIALYPGDISSIRYKGKIRGKTGSFFKNAILINIKTSNRSGISLKLSATSIQLCGASCKEDGIEAAEFVMMYLAYITKILQEFKENLFYCNWFINSSRGSSVVINYESDDSIISCSDNTLNCPIFDFKSLLIQFLINTLWEFEFHSQLVYRIRKIIKYLDYDLNFNDMNFGEPEIAMVNYNYNLEFEIDRQKLAQLIHGKEGFTGRFSNVFVTGCKIELPYEPRENKTIKRRRNKTPHHTFLVYMSGNVTQSGPGGQITKDAYYSFMKVVESIKEEVIYLP